MNNKYYVYIWIRKDNDEIFYVGKGSKNRYKDLSSRNKWFLSIVKKVGIENIEIKILENNLCEEKAFEREMFYIKKYKEEGHSLVNLTNGGEGSSNWYDFLSEEEKNKHKEISKSFLGKHHSEKTKEKMRNSALGRKWDDAHKQKFSEIAKNRPSYFKGKRHSEETKEKLRQKRLNNPTYGKKVYKINENLNIIKTFFSRTECMNLEFNETITKNHIRKSIEKNNNENGKLFLSKNNYIYIYEENYKNLTSESTIERII